MKTTVSIDSVSIVFGREPHRALPLMDQGEGRAEIEAEAAQLTRQLADVQASVAQMENLTKRLSDDYLDLDLLDQQARDVLGLLRSDEIVIR